MAVSPLVPGLSLTSWAAERGRVFGAVPKLLRCGDPAVLLLGAASVAAAPALATMLLLVVPCSGPAPDAVALAARLSAAAPAPAPAPVRLTPLPSCVAEPDVSAATDVSARVGSLVLAPAGMAAAAAEV